MTDDERVAAVVAERDAAIMRTADTCAHAAEAYDEIKAERDAAIAERERLRALVIDSFNAINATVARENCGFHGHCTLANKHDKTVQDYQQRAHAALNPEAKP